VKKVSKANSSLFVFCQNGGAIYTRLQPAIQDLSNFGAQTSEEWLLSGEKPSFNYMYTRKIN